jgi:hypothetical protein
MASPPFHFISLQAFDLPGCSAALARTMLAVKDEEQTIDE